MDHKALTLIVHLFLSSTFTRLIHAVCAADLFILIPVAYSIV